MARPSKFRFRRLDNIGSADAEEDRMFLESCFVDTGGLEVLRDCSDPRRIILGRTGTGKTALLMKLCEIEEKVIEVKPESLALAYISNSTILNFLSELGVKLDIFFKLLWRHVFTVEILKNHFNIKDKKDKAHFILRIRNLFKDDKHAKAIEYLENWGKSFWEETEYRIKEVTTKLEDDLKLSVSQKIPSISFGSETLQKLSEEQKLEIIQRAQHVVNNVQIRQLSDIIELVNDVLNDRKKKYFIIIDRLDEEWVEDKLRYKLIRALIETVKDFRRVSQAKIVVAIRLDLLERVFKLTRTAGFQEEKYESLFLPLEWSKHRLINILDKRIDFLIKQRYTTQEVTHHDVLPKATKRISPIDFMIERTLKRPRDIILFFNFCIQQAAGKPSITVQMLKKAEGEYSRARLRSLADEWYADYPNLIDFAMILQSRPKHFSIEDITENECSDFCLDYLIQGIKSNDILSSSANQVVDCVMSAKDFRKLLFQVFYRVGLVELKIDPYESFWGVSSGGRKSISAAEITDNTRVAIHPAFWRVLGIRDS